MSAKAILLLLALSCLAIDLSHEVRDWFIYEGRSTTSVFHYRCLWYGMVWYGMVWYGMVWYGMVWYGMERQ